MSPIMKLFILLLLTLLINDVKPNHGPNRDSTSENDNDIDGTDYVTDDDDDYDDDFDDDSNSEGRHILEAVAQLQLAANNGIAIVDPETEALFRSLMFDNIDESTNAFDNRDETFDNIDESTNAFDNRDEIPTFPWGNRDTEETSLSDNGEEVPNYPWQISRGGIGRNTYSETEAEIILQVLNERGYAVGYDSDSIARFLNENEDDIHNQPEFQSIVDLLRSTLGAEYRSDVSLMVQEFRNVTNMRGYWTTGTAFSNAIENCDYDYLERLVHAIINYTLS